MTQIASHGKKTAIISSIASAPAFGPVLPSAYSYSQLDLDSSLITNAICASSSQAREPIVLLTPNTYDFASSLLGIWKAGSAAVPLCSTHPPAEWEYYIQDSGSKLIIVHHTFETALRSLAEKLGAKILLTHDLPAAAPAQLSLPESQWVKENALFVYTSGTTGKPKGVVTTHGNVMAAAAAMEEAWEWQSSDHILHVLPLHHFHGLVNALITPLSVGATVEMLPKFDAKLVWSKFVESHRLRLRSPTSPGIITVFMAVPTIYVALIKEFDAMTRERQQECNEALRPLRLMVSGSAALPEPVLFRWEAISGHRLLERYGMTEIGMALTNPYKGAPRLPGRVGRPFPGVEALIRPDPDHLPEPNAPKDVVVGELLIKGPQVFKEYWNRPQATQESFSDGWFLTGDTAEWDPNTSSYRILGRRSVDIIKTGGYKVSALDMETELLKHPSIHEVAVVGIDDLQWGQIVGAIISLKEGVHELTLNALSAWAKPLLANYKIPRRLLVLAQIPRNAMGKVNKKELVKLFKEPSHN